MALPVLPEQVAYAQMNIPHVKSYPPVRKEFYDAEVESRHTGD